MGVSTIFTGTPHTLDRWLLFQIHDQTRNETFTTESDANAYTFFLSRTFLHPTHTLIVWLVDQDDNRTELVRHE